MIPLSYYFVLAGAMFVIGAVGVCLRRNAIVVFMCIELMLNAANIVFVAGSRAAGNLDGQVAVFFVMVVAAAEAAVGLAVILALFRNFASVETSEASELRY